MRSTDLGQCRFTEDLDLQRPLELRVGPEARPADFENPPDDGVWILPEAFKDDSEGIAVLFKKGAFDRRGCCCVKERQDEQDIERPDVWRQR